MAILLLPVIASLAFMAPLHPSRGLGRPQFTAVRAGKMPLRLSDERKENEEQLKERFRSQVKKNVEAKKRTVFRKAIPSFTRQMNWRKPFAILLSLCVILFEGWNFSRSTLSVGAPQPVSAWQKPSYLQPGGLTQPGMTAYRGLTTSVQSVFNPRIRGSWVSDGARLLSPATIRQIDQMGDELRAKTSAELAVVTLNDVAGEPKPFVTKLFNHWGVGDARRNNGVVVLLVPDQRRVEVEIGYGLETTFNRYDWLQRMCDREMSPRFKKGDWDGGVLAGVQLMTERIKSLDPIELEYKAINRFKLNQWAYGGCGVVVVGLAASAYYVDESSKPTCSRCGKKMSSRDGAAWSAAEKVNQTLMVQQMLTEEERLEQSLNTYTYSLWSCKTPDCTLHRANMMRDDGWGDIDSTVMEDMVQRCETVGIRRRKTFYPGYQDCPICRRCTCQHETRVLRPSTYTMSGIEIIYKDCLNCGYSTEKSRVTPMLRREPSSSTYSSSSSSSSGGDFGGGSSGGGGRGSSW